MSVTGKRRSSFDAGTTGAAGKNVKHDYDQVYSNTLRKLHEGAQAIASLPALPALFYSDTELDRGSMLHGVRCHVCNSFSDALPCAYCDRPVCERCLKQCMDCAYFFCTFCTTVNYDQRYDRLFCFDCDPAPPPTSLMSTSVSSGTAVVAPPSARADSATAMQGLSPEPHPPNSEWCMEA